MEKWRKLDGEMLGMPIERAVEEALKLETRDNRIKVCIGSDSQAKGKYYEFATAVVFLREGKGGFIYLNRFKHRGPMSLKERMLHEVSESIGVAYKLCPILDMYKVEMEVHADINTDPQFASNVAFKEAMGYIMGMGYTFKAKPEAFASTYCANKIIQ
jgi:predicted RNase H-related nuclease YkuK (DUF458 family)